MRKPNNKGFSLTEVIVAVAVFLILAIPIFSQLVLSVKNNSKAKASQYGINVAESEMELFKSVDLNALAKIYTKTTGVDASGNMVTTYSLPSIYKDASTGAVKKDQFMTNPHATLSLLEFAEKVQEFKVDSTGVCTFEYGETLTNAESAATEDVTDKDFKVVVTLDPTKYDGDTGETGYNKKDTAVQSLNKDEQAIIGTKLSTYKLGRPGFDDEIRDKFWEEEILSGLTNQQAIKYADDGELPNNYKQWGTFYMFRTTRITIDLNTDPTVSTKGKYVVTTDYDYDCRYKVASVTKTKSYTRSEEKMYFNTVPDIKFYYNQLVVEHVKPGAGYIIMDDAVVFTNKLKYEKMNVEGFTGHGYEYYYTNSDLYFVYNNAPGSCRGHSMLHDCPISFGTGHHSTQEHLNVYYSETVSDADRTISEVIEPGPLLSSRITIESADNKKVEQDFQPIYDIEINVSPENGKGLTTKIEGTRGQ